MAQFPFGSTDCDVGELHRMYTQTAQTFDSVLFISLQTIAVARKLLSHNGSETLAIVAVYQREHQMNERLQQTLREVLSGEMQALGQIDELQDEVVRLEERLLYQQFDHEQAMERAIQKCHELEEKVEELEGANKSQAIGHDMK